MRENRTQGSVRGAPSNGRLYRDALKERKNMIMPSKFSVVIIATFVLNITGRVWAGCNAPNNQGQYTIAITGVKNAFHDGESYTYTCTITPSVSGVTPTWSLDPAGGSGYGLTAPSISENGNSATITFLWHAADPESDSCTYKLTCKTSPNCIAEKTITVSVPDKWGGTYSMEYLGLVREAQSTPGIYHITGTIYGTKLDESKSPNPEYFLPDNSQFMPKTIAHETQHVEDFTGEFDSPAGEQGVIFGDSYLNEVNFMNVDKTADEMDGITSLVGIYINRLLLDGTDSWVELRAYAISDVMDPRYFTMHTHPE